MVPDGLGGSLPRQNEVVVPRQVIEVPGLAIDMGADKQAQVEGTDAADLGVLVANRVVGKTAAGLQRWTYGKGKRLIPYHT